MASAATSQGGQGARGGGVRAASTISWVTDWPGRCTMSTLTSVVGVVHRIFTDQEGAHSSINTPFSLGERLPISFNALVNNHV
jgi:hypothetical protein